MTEQNQTQTEQKIYKINGVDHKLKARYSLREWGKILGIISHLNIKNPSEALIVLMAEDKFLDLLNLILDKPIEGELFEDNFEVIGEVIKDFFSRKQGLMKNVNEPSEK